MGETMDVLVIGLSVFDCAMSSLTSSFSKERTMAQEGGAGVPLPSYAVSLTTEEAQTTMKSS